MTSKKRLGVISTVIILAGIFFLVWAFFHGRKEMETESKEERIGQGASLPSVIGGDRVITLDQESQIKSGIIQEPLKQVSHREEVRAYGTVMDLQTLVGLRKNLIDLRKSLVDAQNNYAAAKGQVKKTAASLVASRKQYERLKALYEDNRNVSDKALQAGEAAFRTDEANVFAAQEALQAARKSVRAAEEALSVLRDAARQQWGNVLTKRLYKASPAFDRLVRQEDVLLQITLPSGAILSSVPETAWVRTATGTRVSMFPISPSPRTDPRIQGLSFFCLASAQETKLLPGMNVFAYLPVGKETLGFLVPSSAVLWWQGKAWVYVQRNADRFTRRELPADVPTENGYFVHQGFTSGETIVVRGGQLLLSEELKSQIQVVEEGEKE